MRFHKHITPRSGNYLGELYDGAMLIHDKEYSTYTVAECALDALIRSVLTDQGLLDDLSAALEAEGVTSMHLSGWDAGSSLCPLCECIPCDCETSYTFATTDVDHTLAGWSE